MNQIAVLSPMPRSQSVSTGNCGSYGHRFLEHPDVVLTQTEPRLGPLQREASDGYQVDQLDLFQPRSGHPGAGSELDEHEAPAVLAPLAVDQAAIRCSWRPRERRALSRAGFDERHKNTQSDTAPCEDVAQGQSRAHQTSLHGWRPGFAPEPQRSVRSDEVVVAPHELDVAAELVRATGVAGRAPTQVRRRLPNRTPHGKEATMTDQTYVYVVTYGERGAEAGQFYRETAFESIFDAPCTALHALAHFCARGIAGRDSDG